MRTFALSCLVLFPLSVAAQVEIDEIMYDLAGSDDGREWVEVVNTGSAPVDTNEWRFSEGDENHKLSLQQGEAVVPPGGFAIIADDTVKFLIDWPGFSGTLFDSSFSLSNTGETISLKSGTTTILDEVTYDPMLGGRGDGNSLQLKNGVWQGALPTPGAATVEGLTPPPSSASGDTTVNTVTATVSSQSQANGSSGSLEALKVHLYPEAGPDITAIAGASTAFAGSALGINKEPLTGGRFLWNFGDGTTAEGRNVFHSYRFPGQYIASLAVSSGEWTNVDETNVRVIPSSLSIARVVSGQDGFVEVANSYNGPVDISGWIIRNGASSFPLPDHTLVAGHAKIMFSNDAMGMLITDPNATVLLYPNDVVAAMFEAPPAENAPKETLPPPVPPAAVLTEAAAAPQSPVTAAAAEEKLPSDEVAVLPPDDGTLPVPTPAVPEVLAPEYTPPLVASAGALPSRNNMLPWLIAAGGLSVITAGVLLLSKRKDDPEGYTVVEGEGWRDDQ